MEANKVKKRLLFLSPSASKGSERECRVNDFQSLSRKAIGEGAFGQVFKVRHIATGNLYAIKVIAKAKVIERSSKLDMDSLQAVCTDSWICMQWTLIYKNLKSGLQDKSVDYYENRDECMEIKKIDCSICFNYDEENAILNPIVYCYGCKLIMHRACIGIHTPPENFMCQVCLSKRSQKCFLCDCKDWPMKNVEPHLLCLVG